MGEEQETASNERTCKMSKRGQNEGSIYQRKDGRWAGAVSRGYVGGKLKRAPVGTYIHLNTKRGKWEALK